ncbi:hypothetical protein RUM43_001347 [Polyplax serrata]|uniref:Magnesium transporter NIPA2 n=1 Tax=Polyplax serrata TaxID=468196 RepID=A0AAN8XRY6_POLSC
MDVSNEDEENNFTIGLVLAVLSTIFIGSSFIIKKKALIKLHNKGNLRAGAGGFGYLKEWTWWAGFLSMGFGEIANFLAYTFAPATLVTPLGALSVLVSAVLASKFLHEKLNLLGKLGCFLCILGSTIIVIHSPRESEVKTLDCLLDNIEDSKFLVYVTLVVLVSASIFFYFGPKYGHQNVVVYILLCSSVGSLTVMACKGLGLAIKESILYNTSQNWFTLFLVVSVFVCVVIQMNYLNKALDLFNTGIVTPVYYVLFTILVIVASTILFSEWENLNQDDIIGNLCGFSTVIVAIILLNGFKDVEITTESVKHGLRSKNRRNFLLGTKKKQVPGDEESLVAGLERCSYQTRNACL